MYTINCQKKSLCRNRWIKCAGKENISSISNQPLALAYSQPPQSRARACRDKCHFFLLCIPLFLLLVLPVGSYYIPQALVYPLVNEDNWITSSAHCEWIQWDNACKQKAECLGNRIGASQVRTIKISKNRSLF